MKLTYNGDIFPGGSASPPYAVTSNATGAGSITSSFCWYTSCGQGRTAPYKVNYIALDNGCPQPFTTTDSLKIILQPMPTVPPAILICMDTDTAGTLQINYADTFSYKRFFSRYDVYKRTGNNPFTLYTTITNPLSNKLFDPNPLFSDTINYCYFFVGYNKCGISGFHSDTICSQSQLTINPVPLISTAIAEDTVFINLPPSADNPYSVFYVSKKDNTNGALFGDYQTLNGINHPYFTDMNQNTSEESYCYTVIKENQCGKLSPISNEACTILLTGESLPGQNVLNWTPYTYWVNDVSRYAIYRKRDDDVSFTLLTKVPKETLTYFDDQFSGDFGIYNYLIKAEDDSTANESLSNIITLKQEAVIFTPNAFTPNGDGKNETWLPISQFVRTFDLSVFNRWGNIVFQSSSKSLPWNGTYNDLPVNQGVYFYKLVFTGYIDNKQQIKTGKVTVIR